MPNYWGIDVSKIDIAWINDEVIRDLVNSSEQLDGYVVDAEEEIDAICITQGNTAVPNIPLDANGYYLSPVLRILAKYKLKKLILDGYEGSSSGNVDIYSEKSDEELMRRIELWESRVTYNSIRLQEDDSSSSSAISRSIPIGG